MKIFINTNDWTISKIENETPIVSGDNYVDAIKVYYNNEPDYLNFYPTINLLKPNGRKVGNIRFDNENYPTQYNDSENNDWWYFVFTLSSDNGQIDEKGKYQVTITTNYYQVVGTAPNESSVITSQRNINVQFNVLNAVLNENNNILILGDDPDAIIADVYQLVQTLNTTVSTLSVSKLNKADVGYFETDDTTATELQINEASKKYCIIKITAGTEQQYYYKTSTQTNYIKFSKIKPASLQTGTGVISVEADYILLNVNTGTLSYEGGILSTYSKAKQDELLAGKEDLFSLSHKLNSDYVDDTNSTNHKFLTSTEKETVDNVGYIETVFTGNYSGGSIVGTLTSQQVAEARKRYCILKVNSTLYPNSAPFIYTFYKAYAPAGVIIFKPLPYISVNGTTKICTIDDYQLTLIEAAGQYYIYRNSADIYTKEGTDENINTVKDLVDTLYDYVGYATEDDSNTTVDRLREIFEFLSGASDDETLLAMLNTKADLTNSNQDIIAKSLKAKVIGDTNVKTTYNYTSNIKIDRVENPNDSDEYAYSYLSKDLIEMYCRKDDYNHSRMDVRNAEASFYVSTLEDATQYMPKRQATSFVGILNYPYMSYEYYENDVSVVKNYFYLNYDGFRVRVNDNELKIDRTSNKLTYNNNEVIDTNNATTELFLTDAEMTTLISEVFD